MRKQTENETKLFLKDVGKPNKLLGQPDDREGARRKATVCANQNQTGK